MDAHTSVLLLLIIQFPNISHGDSSLLDHYRKTCADNYYDCQLNAYLGQCFLNPSYMIPNCRAACEACDSSPHTPCERNYTALRKEVSDAHQWGFYLSGYGFYFESKQECFDECDKDAQCHGAYFDTNNYCWDLYDMAPEMNVDDPGTVLYIKQCKEFLGVCPSVCNFQFQCGDCACVNFDSVCDGTPDCADSTDEINCQLTCKEGEFMCVNVACAHGGAVCPVPNCIWEPWVCDSHFDCSSGKDEFSCKPMADPCDTTGNFACKDGSGCVWHRTICDGIPLCRDSSDEDPELCRSTQDQSDCPPMKLQCATGRCILRSQACDGENDCGDNSDEGDICNGNCVRCITDKFQCSDCSCIGNFEVCDGFADCSQAEDELASWCDFALPPIVPCMCDGQFLCHSDCLCMDFSIVCDNKVDCPDATDELYCQSECRDGEFMCNNKECSNGIKSSKCPVPNCILTSSVCNGLVDCVDGSDEFSGCVGGNSSIGDDQCGPASFLCENGHCIWDRTLCDKQTQCGDWSDELGVCKEENIPSNCDNRTRFTCYNRNCVFPNQTCDGVDDCGDMSDETAICGRSLSTTMKATTSDHTTNAQTTNAQTTKGKTTSEKQVENICVCANKFDCGKCTCIDKSNVCDNKADCADESDELGCTGCGPGEFACESYHCGPDAIMHELCIYQSCIWNGWVCDNAQDCLNNEDEMHCNGFNKTANCEETAAFKCDNGECVWNKTVCNTFADCLDNSDEKHELCFPDDSHPVRSSTPPPTGSSTVHGGRSTATIQAKFFYGNILLVLATMITDAATY